MKNESNSSNEHTSQNKEQFEIVAYGSDYYKTYIWAKNEDDAWNQARQLDPSEFKLHEFADWEIAEVSPLD